MAGGGNRAFFGKGDFAFFSCMYAKNGFRAVYLCRTAEAPRLPAYCLSRLARGESLSPAEDSTSSSSRRSYRRLVEGDIGSVSKQSPEEREATSVSASRQACKSSSSSDSSRRLLRSGVPSDSVSLEAASPSESSRSLSKSGVAGDGPEFSSASPLSDAEEESSRDISC